MLEQLDMRRDVQEIFRMTPHEKQVMMFSATLSKDMRVVCKKFMQDVTILIFIIHVYIHWHQQASSLKNHFSSDTHSKLITFH